MVLSSLSLLSNLYGRYNGLDAPFYHIRGLLLLISDTLKNGFALRSVPRYDLHGSIPVLDSVFRVLHSEISRFLVKIARWRHILDHIIL